MSLYWYDRQVTIHRVTNTLKEIAPPIIIDYLIDANILTRNKANKGHLKVSGKKAAAFFPPVDTVT